MANILIPEGNYAFNKVSKTLTITLPSGNKPELMRLKMVIDTTAKGYVIYNIGDTAKGASISGSTYTLDYNTNTGTFANTDKLHIIYDDDIPQPISIYDLAVVLRNLMQNTSKGTETNKNQVRTIVEDGMLQYVTGIGTMLGLTNVGNLRMMEDMGYPNMCISHDARVRTKIS